MRLIDADGIKLPKGFFEKIDNVPKFYEWLGTLPTVDAVEVVRCKDCAYWGTKVVYANGERADCLNFNFVTPCYFFCKWGERREDGKAD